jgi:ABC-type multidrug transport system fused ATPase/permease subunit
MALNLLIAPMSYFETTSVSKTMNKLSSDLKKVDGEVIPQFRSTIYFIGLTTSFVANSIYVYIRKEQAFMIAAVLGLMLIITYCYFYFIVAIRQLHRLEQESMIPVFSSQVETMVGASTIRAYKREDFMRGKQTAYIEKYLATAKVMAGINSYSTFVISLITTIVTTGLLVKILLGDQENADFFLVYNIFSF